jgi:hypothetical protein
MIHGAAQIEKTLRPLDYFKLAFNTTRGKTKVKVLKDLSLNLILGVLRDLSGSFSLSLCRWALF